MYKILIIEDDLTMAQAIQKEMKMWGNDAQYVQDFKNVLETFAEFDPHLVLMDITLPFYREIRWLFEHNNNFYYIDCRCRIYYFSGHQKFSTA